VRDLDPLCGERLYALADWNDDTTSDAASVCGTRSTCGEVGCYVLAATNDDTTSYCE
jgi:hypothetical protein